MLRTMSRPQIGIDRLPARRMGSEIRESMNCKSCRKRKIKCNRLRPTCEACQVFAVPCIYDAIPKKRGPKTDVLEALLKRVDGLEKRLKTDDKQPQDPNLKKESLSQEPAVKNDDIDEKLVQLPVSEVPSNVNSTESSASATMSPSEPPHQLSQPQYGDVLLDTYFARIHGKPLYILDEASVRQRLHGNQLPSFLTLAIFALSSRYASQYGGYKVAVQSGLEYARRSREELDIDEPSIEGLQALLLLTLVGLQSGRGKKAHMYLASAISMALALNLHREPPPSARVTDAEREGRRKLFWSCYLLDRFLVCGSKRPSLISDESMVLKLPSPQGQPHAVLSEGGYFTGSSNLQYMGSGRQNQRGMGMLIGIVRLLGITNRYLAAGGMKGDSHFPWNSLSNLSKIRQDLDRWAADTQETFKSAESLFGQPDSTMLLLSKLIYHLIHCLIYRPFLPFDLADLSNRTLEQQSWKIEATHMCFLHANAIVELTEIWKTSSIVEWPAFVGYCICTAGTIHVHGANYRGGREGEIFSSSAEFFSCEMQQLSELRYMWNGAQHQLDTLQLVYVAHSELIKSLASDPAPFSPFDYEGFFDRYPGKYFDGAFLTFAELNIDSADEGLYHQTDSPSEKAYSGNYASSIYQSQVYNYPHSNGNSSITLQGMPKRRTTNTQQTPSPMPSSAHSQAIRPRSQTNPSQMTVKIPTLQRGQPPHSANDSGSEQAAPVQSYPFSPSLSFPTMHPQQPPSAEESSRNPESNPYDPMFSVPVHFDGVAASPAPEQSQNLQQQQQQQQQHQSQLQNPKQKQQQTNSPDQQGQELFPSNTAPSAPSSALASGVPEGEPDGDPFLSLLEQLAENEHSRGGPSELDFFLSGG